MSDAFHLVHFGERLARESLRRTAASDCYFRGLRGMGLADSTKAGWKQVGLAVRAVLLPVSAEAFASVVQGFGVPFL